MAIIPTVLKNRDLLSCTIFIVSSYNASTGVITWSSGIDIGSTSGTSSIDNFSFTPSVSDVEVGASDRYDAVHINSKRDFSFQIGEIRNAIPFGSGTGFAVGYGSVVEAAAAQSDYVKVIAVTRAIGSSASSIYHAVMGRITPGTIPIIESGNDGRKIAMLSGNSMGYPPFVGSGTLPSYFS